jgi:hypothetical protein
VTQDHILLSQFLKLPQSGGPGPRIYISQEQGGPEYTIFIMLRGAQQKSQFLSTVAFMPCYGNAFSKLLHLLVTMEMKLNFVAGGINNHRATSYMIQIMRQNLRSQQSVKCALFHTLYDHDLFRPS